MSSRRRSEFGNLGERLRKPTTPFCLVDNRYPGLIIEWVLREEWHARVAWLDHSELRVGEIPATRLMPQTVMGDGHEVGGAPADSSVPLRKY